jgi:hypothetical protein
MMPIANRLGMSPRAGPPTALVHLGAGVGNVVLATPLLLALHAMGLETDVWLSADYPQTADLLRPWSVVREVFTGPLVAPRLARYAHVIPAIPPFYWARFAPRFARLANLVARPLESLFYEDEQEFYLSFARRLGCPRGPGTAYALPIAPDESFGVTQRTVVLAPGCKTGEMATKRWPHFRELAEEFEDVAVVGTADDLRGRDGRPFGFPRRVRSFVDRLTLRQTAELMAAAGVVVGNDSGLAHTAGAVGAPTLILFGPTPHRTLGTFPPNVTVLRQGLPCEPCWFKARFEACGRRISCLEGLQVETVFAEIQRIGSGCLPSRPVAAGSGLTDVSVPTPYGRVEVARGMLPHR